jgi:hypothetical protein
MHLSLQKLSGRSRKGSDFFVMFRQTPEKLNQVANMKTILCVVATAALLTFGALSHARGTPSSSFVPRGPEPHSSLSDKHHSIKSKSASHAAAHQTTRLNPKLGNHTGRTPNSH